MSWCGKPWKISYRSGNFRWIVDAKRLPSGDVVSFNLAVIVAGGSR